MALFGQTFVRLTFRKVCFWIISAQDLREVVSCAGPSHGSNLAKSGAVSKTVPGEIKLTILFCDAETGTLERGPSETISDHASQLLPSEHEFL